MKIFQKLWPREQDALPNLLTFTDDNPSFSSINEIHLAGTETREDSGFVVKEILRTGEWPVIPTKNGVVRKPLRIVRDGSSDKEQGVISLSELLANFKSGPIPAPQVPLSDTDDDHKNTTAVNQGFIRDLWIVDGDNGSKLVAKFEFTEPETKDKVLRGTYADVSCGIPWEIESRGQKYGPTLEHVAITNRPFVDGLGPFLAMSDSTKGAEAAHFSTTEVIEELARQSGAPVDITPAVIDAAKIIESANQQIQRILGDSFDVKHIASDGFFVRSENLKMSWTIPFSVGEDGKTVLANVTEWTSTKDEGAAPAPGGDQDPPAPPAPRSEPNLPEGIEGELEAARRLREMQVSPESQFSNQGGSHMPLKREELEALNLSDMPEPQRAVFQKLLDENTTLAMSSREKDAEMRIGELEELGLKERPGALKLYREVMLADDGGPAVVVLSDGQKKKLTALEILDQFIDGIKGSDNKVNLSAQALVSGNDVKPPLTTEDEKKPFEERMAEMKTALGRS